MLPFHLYDLYVRGAFAGLFAYIWFPLILSFIYKIHESKKPAIYTCYLSLAYAALIMTHLASAFMFSLILGVVILSFLLAMQHGTAVKIACASGCGLGVASIYFIPAFWERKYVHIDYLTNGPLGKYVDNYLFTSDILNLKLPNFYLWLHLEVIADLVLFIIILSVVRSRGYCSHSLPYRVSKFLFLLSFFFTIPLSRTVTDFLPGLSTLQFPWRWIAIMEVSLAFLSSYIFASEERIRNPGGIMNQGSILLIFMLISAAIIGKSSPLPDNFRATIENTQKLSGIMDPVVEYIPKWVHNWDRLNPEPVSFVAGKGTYDVNLWKPQNRMITCTSTVPSKLRVGAFYYPGWEISLDGKSVTPGIEESSGAILIDIPEGDHVVGLQFVNTPLRRFAQWISIALLTLILLVYINSKKKCHNATIFS
jgi:hypothetical protein